MPNMTRARAFGLWCVPGLLLVGSATAFAAFPAGVSTVVLSEPSSPSSASSYSTARFNGGATSGEAGRSTVVAGDLNGDTYPDILVGSPGADSSRGTVYVVYGSASAPAGSINLSSAVAITGISNSDAFGTSLAAADITNDGINDIIVGAPGVSSNKGAVYVIPGGSTLTGGTVTSLTGVLTIGGEADGGRFGAAVAGGDITADGSSTSDGKAELVVGASSAGKVYLIYGPVAAGNVSGASSGNTYNHTLYGYAEDNVGATVVIPNDINNDGTRDLLIGAPHFDNTKTTGNVGGVAYLINGRSKSSWTSSGVTSVSNLNATLSKRRIVYSDIFYGATRVGQIGAGLTGGMDLNSDGYRDIVIGCPTAPRTSSSSAESGRVYILFGSSTTFDTASTFIASAGFPYYYGDTAYDRIGGSLSTAGDIDKDGFVDLLVGASNADLGSSNPGDGNGAAWLVPGRVSASWPTSGDVMSASGNIKFTGKYAKDAAGSSVFGAANLDLDADGYGDIFIGSSGFDVSSSGNEGRVYYLNLGDFYDKDGDGQSLANADCNGTDPAIYYTVDGANEVCDGKDNDCDPYADDADSHVVNQNYYYQDLDQDGYGGARLGTCSNTPPEGYIDQDGDCNDSDAAVNPAAVEYCDGIDNNCDGLTDDSDPGVVDQTPYYGDVDGDGYGDANSGVTYTCSSSAPAGYAATDDDCDDLNAQLNPGEIEYCDGIDSDCDGMVDDDAVDGITFYQDADGDGYGNASATLRFCTEPTGYVDNSTDCDDNNSQSYPGATELCDAKDNNCDDVSDEYVDSFDQDNDAYLDADQCAAYGSATGEDLDCDDSNPNIYPGGDEVDDGVDNDCDGRVDESGACKMSAADLKAMQSGAPARPGLFLGGPLTLLAFGLGLIRRRSRS